jgi:hypothetical protein
MNSILILLSSLLFNAGVATVHADPAVAAKAITTSIQTLEKMQPASCECCPEWLCRLLGCCEPRSGCTSGPCGPACCGR